MNHHIKSIRPFIGAKDFTLSRSFYRDLGFEETLLEPNLALVRTGNTSFYLQNGYVKDWVDNTMVFLEVDDADRYYQELSALNLPAKYPGVKVTPTRTNYWGKECFVHDPSGILWHFGEFFKK